VDFSCHIQTNVSVRRGIARGTSVLSIHKGEVLIFSSLYIFKGYSRIFEVTIDVQKGVLRFGEEMAIDVLVSSNSHSPLLSYNNNPQ
jgi:hypothetical protein